MEILHVAVGDALTREKGQVVRVGDRDEEESESEEEDEELFFSDSSSMGPVLTARGVKVHFERTDKVPE